MKATTRANRLYEPALVRRALLNAFRKLHPRDQSKTPIIFVVWVCAAMTTALGLLSLAGIGGDAPVWFTFWIALGMWATVLSSNFAEAMAEARGKAQAEALGLSRRGGTAQRLQGTTRWRPGDRSQIKVVPSSMLRSGDLVLVEAGHQIPGDGVVAQGVATVDESALTGESAPVVREPSEGRNSVTGGTRVLSDWIVVRITTNPGENVLDRILRIAFIAEGARRHKTPNELALNTFLVSLTMLTLLACATLLPFSYFAADSAGGGSPVPLPVVLALLVCLIPTTIGGLLSAIGIAGMDRMLRQNVIATSGRAIEAAGDVNLLLLDKTGTITLGNRQAVEFIPARGATDSEVAVCAQLSSLSDDTPEGRSIVALARERFGVQSTRRGDENFVTFTAQTRMSGVDLNGSKLRKGAADAIRRWVERMGGNFPDDVQAVVNEVGKAGGTPLVVAEKAQGPARVVGVVHLKDIVKGGIRGRFAELRSLGIKTVMVTGDNPLTAATIAAEAGVDDFLAEATPEAKLKYLRESQEGGRVVAMTGDGANDAPALAQADVAVVMNSGTVEAKEAANMVDLDNNPTKLIEIVGIGRQMLLTRGALMTFGFANDVAKYVALLPAAFATVNPDLARLNLLGLQTPESAILSTVLFNTLVIVALTPLALRGVRYYTMRSERILRTHLIVYGLSGLVTPFVMIKLFDMGIGALLR